MKRLLAAAVSVCGMSVPAWAQWHMHDWGMGWGGGMAFGLVLTVGLIILLIVLAVTFLRSLGADTTRPTDPTAREILDQRYARGEIDREEYLRRRQDISNEP